jgi:hypothetical protein
MGCVSVSGSVSAVNHISFVAYQRSSFGYITAIGYIVFVSHVSFVTQRPDLGTGGWLGGRRARRTCGSQPVTVHGPRLKPSAVALR